MGYIEKEKCLIARDGEGNLLPIEVVLESLPEKPLAKLTPLTKGEFQSLIATPEVEDELIRAHLHEPSFTEDEFKHIKPALYGAFKIALLSLTTDTSQKDLQDSSNKALLDAMEQKKKSIGTSSD